MRGAGTSRVTALSVFVLIGGAGASVVHTQTESSVTFTDHIRPIFDRSCWHCHGEASQQSDLDLRTRETVIEGGARGTALVPGRADESRLYRVNTRSTKSSASG